MSLALVKLNGGIYMRRDYTKMTNKASDDSEEIILPRIKNQMKQDVPPLKPSLEDNMVVLEEQSDGEPDKELRGVVVNCNKLNVRKGPGKTFDVICVIDKGTEVAIEHLPTDLDLDDVWAPVRINDIVGYVMGEYLKEV